MTSGEGSFVDANVLVYAALKEDVRHAACRSLLRNPSGHLLYLSPQILAEFYSTITSPKRVNTPLTAAAAIEFIETLLGHHHIVLLPISADVPARWLSLLKRSDVRGPLVFDFQIAATMLAHGVTKLITYNGADFKSVSEIEILEPPSANPSAD